MKLRKDEPGKALEGANNNQAETAMSLPSLKVECMTGFGRLVIVTNL